MTVPKLTPWLPVIAGLIAGTLVVAAIMIWKNGLRLEQRLAAIRAAGDPTTVADLAGSPISAEQNAATHLRQASKDAEAVESRLTGIIDRLREQRYVADSDLSEIATAFAAHPKLIPLLRKAADCQGYDTGVDYTAAPDKVLDSLLPDFSEIRRVGRMLTLHAELSRHQGERDEALDDCGAMLRFSRLVDDQFMIGYLVSLAVRREAIEEADLILRSGPVSPQAQDRLIEELGRYDALESFRCALKRERVYGLVMTDFEVVGAKRLLRSAAKLRYLDLVDGQLNAETFADSKAAVDNRPAAGFIQFPELDHLGESFHGMRQAMEQARARTSCLAVLIALRRISKPDMAEAPKLEDLGLSAETTTDPFTGAPLLLKRAAGGWLVYSVGRDLTDDSGDLRGQRDIGLGPTTPLTREIQE